MFDWSNAQNGYLIGFIGIISAVLQGGYVRRAMHKVGEGKMARQGVSVCAIGFVLLSILPLFATSNVGLSVKLLQASAVCLAFTSATVVNSLTAYASLQCDDIGPDGPAKVAHPALMKGKALGKFRSSGQLGRAIGPLLGKFYKSPLLIHQCSRHIITACASYWTVGPSVTYGIAAVAMLMLSLQMKSIAKPRRKLT